MELPKYVCHKEVHAAKITGVNKEALLLIFGEINSHIMVDSDWLKRFAPEAGGYFVVYEDGYTSFSPAEAFESGYTKT
jgi:hypothetical protein